MTRKVHFFDNAPQLVPNYVYLACGLRTKRMDPKWSTGIQDGLLYTTKTAKVTCLSCKRTVLYERCCQRGYW